MKAPNVVPDGAFGPWGGHLGVGIAARPAAMVRCSSVSSGCTRGDFAPCRGRIAIIDHPGTEARGPSVYRHRRVASVFGFAASRTPREQRPTAAARHEPNPRLAPPSLRAQCVRGISKRERNDVKRCAGGVQERLSRRLVDTGRRARPAGPCLFGRAGRRPISGRRSTCGARCRKEGARDSHGKAGNGDLAQ
jgi:hypothetical protein